MKIYILIILIMFTTVIEAITAPSIDKRSQWPYTSTLPYLQPSPNSLAFGAHGDYASGIVIWAVGDTITIYNADGLDYITSFRVDTPKLINDLYYKDLDNSETLYLALGTGGLQIFDLTDFSSPGLSSPDGTYSVSGADPGYLLGDEVREIDATGVGYYDNRIFLTDNNFGLRVIDVSTMAAPFEVLLEDEATIIYCRQCIYNPSTGQLEDDVRPRTSGYIQPNVSGAYSVTGGYNNIEVIPFDYPGPVEEIVYAVVHDYYHGIRVFDVTDPKVIDEPVSRFLSTDNWFLYNALINDIYVTEGTDYDPASPENRLYAYVTAADTSNNSVVARLDLLSADGVLEDLIVGNETVYSINNVGRHLTPGVSSGVFAKGDHVYVADMKADVINSSDPDIVKSGLQIVDISTGSPINDNTPVLNYDAVASYVTDVPIALSLTGDDNNNIYLHDALNGLHKININITSPDTVSTSLVGTMVASRISGDSVFVEGDYAYCLDSDDGFRIFDISEPTLPALEGFFATTGNDIVTSGDYAYVAKGSDGLQIVDISTKSTPTTTPAMLVDTADNAVAVDLYQHSSGENYACVADSDSGVSIINITVPTAPGAPEVIDDGSDVANDICVSGNYAYIANDSEGLKIIDLSQANVPNFPNSWTKSTTGTAVAVSVYVSDTATYAYIAVGGQIIIEDVTDPAAIPATKGAIDPEGDYDVTEFVSLEIIDNYLFASAGTEGVYVYDLSVNPENPSETTPKSVYFPSKEIAPFEKDDVMYCVSAEGPNVMAVYELYFPEDLASPLSDDGESLSCFISTVSQ